MAGRRIFRPRFRTKNRNFPALESMMKQKICPRNVLGHFRTKIRPKCFDETGPRIPWKQKSKLDAYQILIE